MHNACTKWGMVMWESSRLNVILDPLMHGKCTMHARKGRGLHWNRVGGMKFILYRGRFMHKRGMGTDMQLLLHSANFH